MRFPVGHTIGRLVAPPDHKESHVPQELLDHAERHADVCDHGHLLNEEVVPNATILVTLASAPTADGVKATRLPALIFSTILMKLFASESAAVALCMICCNGEIAGMSPNNLRVDASTITDKSAALRTGSSWLNLCGVSNKGYQ